MLNSLKMSSATKLLIVFLVFFVFCSKKTSHCLDNVEGLIKDAGFESEVHFVKTVDGYILKLHRIKPKKKERRLGPVFLFHGLALTSADYVLSGPGVALGFLLSFSGYDVWLGNSRGNNHCLNHSHLDSSVAGKFWDFSFHEIGLFDVSAMIDKVLQETRSSKLFYVGQSQGASTVMILLALRPEYNQKIIHAHLLTPAVFMKHSTTPILKLFPGDFEIIHQTRLSFFENIIREASYMVCDQASPTVELCKQIYFFVCGSNKYHLEIDVKILKYFLRHISSSVAAKQIAHFSQLTKIDGFRQFDYGEGNKERYNSTTPPEYNLMNVIIPTYIYSGECDALTSYIDVEHLSQVLPNVRLYRKIPNFNHCDLTLGKNSRQTLFMDILAAMNSEK